MYTIIISMFRTWLAPCPPLLAATKDPPGCNCRVYPPPTAPHAPEQYTSLVFTRYSFTSRLLFTNQPSFHSPRPSALLTLVQYYCTIIGLYTTPLPTSRLYAIHHTILVITISCKGQITVGQRRSRLLPKPTGAWQHLYPQPTAPRAPEQYNSGPAAVTSSSQANWCMTAPTWQHLQSVQ